MHPPAFCCSACLCRHLSSIRLRCHPAIFAVMRRLSSSPSHPWPARLVRHVTAVCSAGCCHLSSVHRRCHLSSVIHPPLPPSVIHLVIPRLLHRIRLSVIAGKTSDIPDAAAIGPVLVLPFACRRCPSTAHPCPHRPTCWPPLPRICWIFPMRQLPTC